MWSSEWSGILEHLLFENPGTARWILYIQYSTGIFRLVLIAGYQTSTGTLEKFSEFMSKGGILEGTMKIKSRLGSARFK
jgi:hypothetical protein